MFVSVCKFCSRPMAISIQLQGCEPNLAAWVRRTDMNSCVDRVEALVADSLRASQGSCALEASAAVEAAVHRARAKGKLLRHLDSGLLLSAAQEAEEEVGSLLRVTDINAEAMQEVSATAGAGFLAAEEEEKTASVRTQAGEPAPATELGSADDSASAVSLPSSQAPASGAGWDCAEVATRVVAPLRLLAAEIQAEESQADPSSMGELCFGAVLLEGWYFGGWRVDSHTCAPCAVLSPPCLCISGRHPHTYK